MYHPNANISNVFTSRGHIYIIPKKKQKEVARIPPLDLVKELYSQATRIFFIPSLLSIFFHWNAISSRALPLKIRKIISISELKVYLLLVKTFIIIFDFVSLSFRFPEQSFHKYFLIFLLKFEELPHNVGRKFDQLLQETHNYKIQ